MEGRIFRFPIFHLQVITLSTLAEIVWRCPKTRKQYRNRPISQPTATRAASQRAVRSRRASPWRGPTS
jgi:hypothetical protein